MPLRSLRFVCSWSVLLVPVLMGGVVSAADTSDGIHFTQQPEIAPATQRIVTPAPVAEAGNDSDAPLAKWIWGADASKKYVLKNTFTGGSTGSTSARLRATCDNVMTVYINGQKVAYSAEWQAAVNVDVQKYIKEGENVLTAEVEDQGGASGFILRLRLTGADGKPRYIVSDDTWQAAAPGSDQFAAAKTVGKLGDAPWGNVFSGTGPAPAQNQGFNLQPGFQVELLFTVPKDVLGSWVAIGLDDKGRIIASDQGDKGLCRITPSPIGSGEPTKVERLSVKMSGVQGILQAFGSLYVCANGGPGSGLYRLRDTDGDDQYDEVVKLKEIRGGGEHGPHALRLSPDGKSIYLIAGNHTPIPFDLKRTLPPQTMGGVRAEQFRAELPEGAASRIAPNWDEDLLLPRQWDGNGHAAGILAPGGWIAKTDPDGKAWEIVSMGYRNPYDMAFNADGELFAYDADMEWDVGSPWYRFTRVTHATSGSEFGWRSGTGKWPWYYADSLPPLVDVGPGSPVGVEFGYGTKFPAKYQKALYICDWTFGTMYAIHIEPAGSSYKAVREDFLSKTPLPLTDNVVGKDGALYFSVGGRGTQSELYRLTYVGQESVAPVALQNAEDANLRELRHQIEAYHREGADAATAVPFLVPYLGHADQHIRYAARVALERIPVAAWEDKVLGSNDVETIISGTIGLAREAEPALQPRLIELLGRVDFSKLTEIQQLSLLRAYQLVIIRLGLPEEAARPSLGAKFDALYPSPYELVNRELAILMVALSSPQAVQKLLPALTRERVMSQTELGDVLKRNQGYGGSIAAMLANQPDQMQMHLAFTLRNLKTGWKLDEKKTYFSWFDKARTWSGGNSYQKFLINMDKDAYENSTDVERLAVEAAGARKPYKAPELPKPQGPGKDYTLDELVALSATHLTGRSFDNGKKMFAASRCVICHRFGGDGGATGPDLTQAAGRFSFKDLTEAIVDPSKVVSDQYKTTVVQTTGGQTYTGRVISIIGDNLTLLIDPEDATKTVTLKKAEIDEQTLSPTSLMPKDLLKTLNQDEVLDLLAYILSRGNPNDAMFRK